MDKDNDTSPWYTPYREEWLPESTRDLLMNYSHQSPDKLTTHLITMRDRMWEIENFPCIGCWSFLNTIVDKSPQYSDIIKKAQNGGKILDIGCCVGQELRKMAFDGAPSSNLYGTDLHSKFWPLSFELWNDRKTFRGHFEEADIFDKNSHIVKKFPNAFDVIILNFVIHLFSYDRQKEAVCNVFDTLLRHGAGTIVCGAMVGLKEAGPPNLGKNGPSSGKYDGFYSHNKESFRKFWEEISTDLKLNLEINIDSFPLFRSHQGDVWKELGAHVLQFTVTVT